MRAAKSEQHIAPIAALLFGVFIVIGIVGIPVLSNLGASDNWLGAWSGAMTLKVDETAVVRRTALPASRS